MSKIKLSKTNNYINMLKKCSQNKKMNKSSNTLRTNLLCLSEKDDHYINLSEAQRIFLCSDTSIIENLEKNNLNKGLLSNSMLSESNLIKLSDFSNISYIQKIEANGQDSDKRLLSKMNYLQIKKHYNDEDDNAKAKENNLNDNYFNDDNYNFNDFDNGNELTAKSSSSLKNNNCPQTSKKLNLSHSDEEDNDYMDSSCSFNYDVDNIKKKKKNIAVSSKHKKESPPPVKITEKSNSNVYLKKILAKLKLKSSQKAGQVDCDLTSQEFIQVLKTKYSISEDYHVNKLKASENSIIIDDLNYSANNIFCASTGSSESSLILINTKLNS